MATVTNPIPRLMPCRVGVPPALLAPFGFAWISFGFVGWCPKQKRFALQCRRGRKFQSARGAFHASDFFRSVRRSRGFQPLATFLDPYRGRSMLMFYRVQALRSPMGR